MQTLCRESARSGIEPAFPRETTTKTGSYRPLLKGETKVKLIMVCLNNRRVNEFELSHRNFTPLHVNDFIVKNSS